MEVLEKINALYCDDDGRPYQDFRIRHTYILDDPFPDPDGLSALEPPASPAAQFPAQERVKRRLAYEEGVSLEADAAAGGMTEEELDQSIRRKEAQARAIVLEMTGDLPDADVKPPEEVLFVCKLNAVTTSEDLELIFSRFGTIKGCEVIRDFKTGDSLNYAFIEFETEAACIEAYNKMNNALIDDRRIKVDFSQSVSKLWNRFLLRPRSEQRQQDQALMPNTSTEIGAATGITAGSDVGRGRRWAGNNAPREQRQHQQYGLPARPPPPRTEVPQQRFGGNSGGASNDGGDVERGTGSRKSRFSAGVTSTATMGENESKEASGRSEPHQERSHTQGSQGHGRDQERDRERNGGSNRDRDQERDRERNGGSNRDRDQERDRERNGGSNRDRDQERDRERNGGRGGVRDGSRERCSDDRDGKGRRGGSKDGGRGGVRDGSRERCSDDRDGKGRRGGSKDGGRGGVRDGSRERCSDDRDGKGRRGGSKDGGRGGVRDGSRERCSDDRDGKGRRGGSKDGGRGGVRDGSRERCSDDRDGKGRRGGSKDGGRGGVRDGSRERCSDDRDGKGRRGGSKDGGRGGVRDGSRERCSDDRDGKGRRGGSKDGGRGGVRDGSRERCSDDRDGKGRRGGRDHDDNSRHSQERKRSRIS